MDISYAMVISIIASLSKVPKNVLIPIVIVGKKLQVACHGYLNNH